MLKILVGMASVGIFLNIPFEEFTNTCHLLLSGRVHLQVLCIPMDSETWGPALTVLCSFSLQGAPSPCRETGYSIVLKLECASEAPGGGVKTQISRFHPQSTCFKRSEVSQEFALLTSSQLLLLLPVIIVGEPWGYKLQRMNHLAIEKQGHRCHEQGEHLDGWRTEEELTAERSTKAEEQRGPERQAQLRLACHQPGLS